MRARSMMQSAAAAGGPQGVSLMFSASTVYCLPLFAMVLFSQLLLAGHYARLSIPEASDSIDTGSVVCRCCCFRDAV